MQLHAIIHGYVQGVSFRYYTLQKAQELHLTGWVRNRHDGTVETVAAGDQLPLQQFLDWLQVGPPAARVNEVETDWSDAPAPFGAFIIRHE